MFITVLDLFLFAYNATNCLRWRGTGCDCCTFSLSFLIITFINWWNIGGRDSRCGRNSSSSSGGSGRVLFILAFVRILLGENLQR